MFDIITTDDRSQFECLADAGRGIRQMWDKRVDAEFNHNTYIFIAYFSDGQQIEIVVNPEFGSSHAARTEALRYTKGLGQLPLLFRQGIRQFGIHKGNETYSAGPGKIFVYADKTSRRIRQNHLEESLLHEAVHASLDAQYAKSKDWIAAQEQDGTFLTSYAAAHPASEDLAETALFVYGLIQYPDRIPPVDTHVIKESIPARIRVFSDILNTAPNAGKFGPRPDGCR
ncbi:MAG: hypothetical protein ACU0CA_06005 [Paracoccaceae bacterium]